MAKELCENLNGSISPVALTQFAGPVSLREEVATNLCLQLTDLEDGQYVQLDAKGIINLQELLTKWISDHPGFAILAGEA